jgi:hypothetical protein
MKKLFLILTAAALPLLGRAQAVAPKIAPLTNLAIGTNAATFTLAGGALLIPASTTTNIYSQPFALYRDRGFAGNVGFWSTNAVTANTSFVFQFATPVKVGTAYITNWLSSPTVTNTYAANGTNEVYAATLTASTTAQNFAIARLAQVITASAAPIYLDPTNTFAGIVP